MLVYVIPVDLDKLLQDRRLAAGAFDCESSRVMEMTIDLPSMFVVRVLRSKDRRAD
jgi:hypothetical protein